VNTPPWSMVVFIATVVRLMISDHGRLCSRMATTYRRGTVRGNRSMGDTAAENTESRRPPVIISGHARLSSRDGATSKVTSPRSNPHRFIRAHPMQQCPDLCFRYSRVLDLQSLSEPTPFHPLNPLILVKDRATSLNKICSLNISLQTYYRILGSKPGEFKDMVCPNWSHTTVTISNFDFSFSYPTLS
jgi:hypothetical protein